MYYIEKMQIINELLTIAYDSYVLCCRVPKNITFGSGIQKGFTRPKVRFKTKGNHLTKKPVTNETHIDIEDVDMNDLVQSLQT